MLQTLLISNGLLLLSVVFIRIFVIMIIASCCVDSDVRSSLMENWEAISNEMKQLTIFISSITPLLIRLVDLSVCLTPSHSFSQSCFGSRSLFPVLTMADCLTSISVSLIFISYRLFHTATQLPSIASECSSQFHLVRGKVCSWWRERR